MLKDFGDEYISIELILLGISKATTEAPNSSKASA
jgi:hypothetical protein